MRDFVSTKRRALQLMFGGAALAFVCLILRYELADLAEHMGLGSYVYGFFADRWAVAVCAIVAFYGGYRLTLLRHPD